ncbi:UNVERIFIED_CONTAM: hypothetical protein ABID98_002565 [Brevibacillus sp. OAP136]
MVHLFSTTLLMMLMALTSAKAKYIKNCFKKQSTSIGFKNGVRSATTLTYITNINVDKVKR